MVITKTDIIGKIRKAIDDIVPSGVTDSFETDVNDELWQAVQQAAIQLSLELPLDMLDGSIKALGGTVDSTRGFAYDKVGDDYLRFVYLDVTNTAGIIRSLMEAGSDEEKMQSSAWSRATASKPKAMLDLDETGAKVIVWWPGDNAHTSAELAYIATPEVINTVTEEITTLPAIVCSIRSEAEQQVIFRAASIFFEGKKEGAIADRFKNM